MASVTTKSRLRYLYVNVAIAFHMRGLVLNGGEVSRKHPVLERVLSFPYHNECNFTFKTLAFPTISLFLGSPYLWQYLRRYDHLHLSALFLRPDLIIFVHIQFC